MILGIFGESDQAGVLGESDQGRRPRRGGAISLWHLGIIGDMSTPPVVLAPLLTPPGTPLAPSVGLKEAARVCGVSVATVRRRKDSLIAHGATTAEDGWMIPIPALVAVGLLDRTSPPDTLPRVGQVPTAISPDDAALASLRDELATERLARVTAEHRAALAEAVMESQSKNLEDVRRALRALTAAPTSQSPTEPVPLSVDLAETPVSQRPAKSWWRRL
jgi:hypothetical protein